jgi:hypothetical protein
VLQGGGRAVGPANPARERIFLTFLGSRCGRIRWQTSETVYLVIAFKVMMLDELVQRASYEASHGSYAIDYSGLLTLRQIEGLYGSRENRLCPFRRHMEFARTYDLARSHV